MTNAGLAKRQAELQQARENAVFSIADDDARAVAAAERGGLVVPVLDAGGPDIGELEEQHRRASFAAPVLFCGEDDEDGTEVLDDGEGEKWRVRMDWPRTPTVDEIWAWVRYESALAAAKEWERRFGQPGSEP
ncbi:hypothetical protein HAP47_0000345 [Bradyrhizobium sp. 41S5]|uniref:hypothetical protein n=1 Tax=Bradyrhizobium sp. 41S5 TaxID=1404443 RepID=UPI00156B13D5|nr:hypothetical protein [Bradyrhizobium sp. 41S5]UFX45227.1 hypothetical protein HAP47_0000345 [Bradyrhizobium sp. 41S5]